jgi:L-malate glycosyltransferase
MKVLFYNHTGQVSGAERVLLMILARLNRHSFRSVVICPDEGPLSELAVELGVTVENIAPLQARFTWRLNQLFAYAKSFFGVMLLLRRRVCEIKPDILHANSIRAGLVATTATFGLKTRVVWHLHDLLPRHPLSTLIRVFAALSRRSSMIAVSEAVAKNFRGRLTPLLQERVKVILNAIDLETFAPGKTTRREIQKQIRIRESDLILGIVGQITPRKGQLELLRAFAEALIKIPNSVLLIVGAPLFNRDHEYLELLKRTISELGIGKNARILGARSDIPAVMQALDLLIVNSTAEPFGLVIPEAMACGTPVLATAIDGIPEIVEHGETGWLVRPGNEDELSEAIVYLARRSELRETLAKRGRAHVRERFSLRRYLTELENFYGSITPARLEAVKVAPTDQQAEAA